MHLPYPHLETLKTIVLICLVCTTSGVALFFYESNPRIQCSNADPAYKELCYENLVESDIIHHGTRSAFVIVADAYQHDPAFRPLCHRVTHAIGKADYKNFHTTGIINIESSASACGFGYYHGFMEEMIQETGSLDDAKQFCKQVGTTLVDQKYSEGACYHGIGHGVTDGYDESRRGDPYKLSEPGLALCKKITNVDEFLMRCASGVFNSLALMYADPTYKLTAPRNPYSICAPATYTPQEKQACYAQMNTLLVRTYPHDRAHALQTASHVVLPYRAVAVKSLAGFYGSRPQPLLASSLLTECRTLDETSHLACIEGIIGGTMEFGTPGSEYVLALHICVTSDLSEPEMRACTFALQVGLGGMYSTSTRQTACKQIPEVYRKPICQ